MEESGIKVFISYSWDSSEHRKKVKNLVNELRANSINVMYDNDMELGERISYFMEKGISQSSYVLFICTPNYKLKADSRKGGAGYENTIITSELYSTQNERKFIPVLFTGNSIQSFPAWSRDKLGVDLSFPTGSPEYNEGLKKLIASLKKEPQNDNSLSVVTEPDNKTKKKVSKKMIGVLTGAIGFLSAIITIFVFFSGRGTFQEVISPEQNPAQDTVSLQQTIETHAETEYSDSIYLHGNSNSNLNAEIQGFAAQKNDVLYLAYNDYVFELNEDSGNASKFAVASQYACINTADDWVYICSYTDLYRTKANGSKHEKIFTGNASQMRYTLYNGKIYFIELGMNFGIARIETDGSGYEKIVSTQAFFIFFDENWLYFDDGMDNNIYRINIENVNEIETFVSDKKGMTFKVENNWLYYESERYGKCRINVKTNDVQSLPNAVIFDKSFINGDYLYYLYLDYLMRMPLNSNSEPEEFIKLPFGLNLAKYSFNCTDDWIFVLAPDDSSDSDELHLLQYPIEGGDYVDIGKLLKKVINFTN